MFRASSAHLQEDIVVYKQHMVPSLSIRVPGGLLISSYSCISTGHQDSYREWRYHMLLVYNYILLKMSTWCSKHVEESNILRINNSQCIKLVIKCMVNSWCTVRKTLGYIWIILSLTTEIVCCKESKIKLNWMSLNDDSEIEYPGLLRQNCIWRSGWCGSGSVNAQFDINLATCYCSKRVNTCLYTVALCCNIGSF